MRIGITFDLKVPDDAVSDPVSPGNRVADTPALPDDWQEEFDSPVTIDAIAAVLRGLGHQLSKLGDGRGLLERLLADPPDLVFNFAEGQGVARSREARVPAVLEMLGIPYTGSDPLTLAATLDKDCAKRLVASAGIAVPDGFCVYPDDDPSEMISRKSPKLCFPAIIKPAWEGSSKGIRNRCLVCDPSELADAVGELLEDYRQPVLVEEYIAGEELTVGVIGNRPAEVLGTMRVVPLEKAEHFIYSLEVKRDYLRQVRYECPPLLPARDLEAVEAAARMGYRALGCRDVARVDFRLRDGVPYFLEVNPLPGLNPETSDLVIIAELVGWSYERLIETILNAALVRIAAEGQALTV